MHNSPAHAVCREHTQPSPHHSSRQTTSHSDQLNSRLQQGALPDMRMPACMHARRCASAKSRPSATLAPDALYAPDVQYDVEDPVAGSSGAPVCKVHTS